MAVPNKPTAAPEVPLGAFDDVMKALKRISVRKRVAALPQELEALRRRVEELEAIVAGSGGADRCPVCDATGFKRYASVPFKILPGVMMDSYRCPVCSHEELRMRDTLMT